QIDEPGFRLAEEQDAADVRMIEPHGESRFAPQALDRALVRSEARREDFDGDRVTGRDFPGEIHVRHPAFTQLFHDLIAGVQDLIGETRGAVQARLPGWEWRPDA